MGIIWPAHPLLKVGGPVRGFGPPTFRRGPFPTFSHVFFATSLRDWDSCWAGTWYADYTAQQPKKDPTCEYVFLRILIPLIPNLVTVWRYRTPFWSAPLRITPLWRGYSFQNWGCSYNHHSIQSFARGYHDEFPWLAPTLDISTQT